MLAASVARTASQGLAEQLTGDNKVSFDLQAFKVYPCKQGRTVPHDRKLCVFYHNLRDRRRPSGSYAAEPCSDCFDMEMPQPSRCSRGDDCPKCHNRLELLYHPEVFKKRFCATYPTVALCQRGSYCAFAHSREEIGSKLFNVDEEDGAGGTDDFYMYSFKTLWCPYGTQHDWHQCVYAHTYQDWRRCPQLAYGSEPCPHWARTGQAEGKNVLFHEYQDRCPNGFLCQYSHGSKEQLYHPSYYKTMPCTDQNKFRHCPRGILCAFYHSEAERRKVQPSKFNYSSSLPESELGKLGTLQPGFKKPPLFGMDGERLYKLYDDPPVSPGQSWMSPMLRPEDSPPDSGRGEAPGLPVRDAGGTAVRSPWSADLTGSDPAVPQPPEARPSRRSRQRGARRQGRTDGQANQKHNENASGGSLLSAAGVGSNGDSDLHASEALVRMTLETSAPCTPNRSMAGGDRSNGSGAAAMLRAHAGGGGTGMTASGTAGSTTGSLDSCSPTTASGSRGGAGTASARSSRTSLTIATPSPAAAPSAEPASPTLGPLSLPQPFQEGNSSLAWWFSGQVADGRAASSISMPSGSALGPAPAQDTEPLRTAGGEGSLFAAFPFFAGPQGSPGKRPQRTPPDTVPRGREPAMEQGRGSGIWSTGYWESGPAYIDCPAARYGNEYGSASIVFQRPGCDFRTEP